MKILNNIIKPCTFATLFSIGAINSSIFAQNTNTLIHDVFEYTHQDTTIYRKGTTDINILKAAPNPKVKIANEDRIAKFVVDINKNILYKYDNNGNAEIAYSIASGAKSTPTHLGVRLVSHTEDYPYRKAPYHTKRRKSPRAYGPHAIILDRVDTQTGERSSIGEFIHGNNNSSSIGKYVSHGCMRMDNEVITKLYKQVKRGDVVLIVDSSKK